MDLSEHIEQCKINLADFEKLQDFEKCAELRDLIKSIEQKDSKSYIQIMFDLDGLQKSGFLKKGLIISEIEIRICNFFELKSIYDYSLIIPNNKGCRFHRELEGWS